jgi:FkbM family methyltransferase
VAELNLAPYGKRVQLLLMGLWSRSCLLSVRGSVTGSFVSEASHRDAGVVEAITVSDLLKAHSIDKVSILKMDIEGAEEQVFTAPDLEWLDGVRVLLIEFHSRHGRQQILSLLRLRGFSVRRWRSVYYAFNTQL